MHLWCYSMCLIFQTRVTKLNSFLSVNRKKCDIIQRSIPDVHHVPRAKVQKNQIITGYQAFNAMRGKNLYTRTY